jgi:hypothetical protein
MVRRGACRRSRACGEECDDPSLRRRNGRRRSTEHQVSGEVGPVADELRPGLLGEAGKQLLDQLDQLSARETISDRQRSDRCFKLRPEAAARDARRQLRAHGAAAAGTANTVQPVLAGSQPQAAAAPPPERLRFFVQVDLQGRQRAVGMEPFMELPRSRTDSRGPRTRAPRACFAAFVSPFRTIRYAEGSTAGGRELARLPLDGEFGTDAGMPHRLDEPAEVGERGLRLARCRTSSRRG